jgi:phosphatidylserine synthase
VTCVVAILYAIGAVERLAWFNITTEENPDRFVGLPVIYSALLLPLVYLLGLYLPAAVMPWLWRGSYLLMAVLFVTGFETKKPSLAFRLGMLLVAVGIIVALCVLP